MNHRPIALLALAALLAMAMGGAPSGARAQLSVVNVAPSFPPGPYVSLHVDPFDPMRVAVGTQSGLVGVTEDGGRMARETRALSPRRYDAMALRGNSARSHLAHPLSGRGSTAQRAIRLFIQAMHKGGGVARWAFWMAISEPFTEVSAIGMPREGGRLVVASPAGVLVSDRAQSAWTRTFGGPGPMAREKDPVAFSATVDPEDPKHIIVGTTEGVLVSNDGGFNFSPHPDKGVREEYIFGFFWDPVEPGLLLAITYDGVLQSYDSGRSFQLAFSAGVEVLGVALLDEGAYVATAEGLTMVDAQGTERKLLRGHKVVGVVPWPGGAVAATETDLLFVAPGGEPIPLARTTKADPFLNVRGVSGMAWAITHHAVFRIGGPPERVVQHPRGPRMLLSGSECEEAVLEHLDFGKPDDVRLHPRWYAKLLPRIEAEIIGHSSREDETMFDGTFPIRFRTAGAMSRAEVEWSIMARWDLSEFAFGDHNVVNPNLFLERTLRDARDHILRQVRWRYRETAMLVRRMQHPPADLVRQLSIKMRLEEHVAYLEALAGRPLVEGVER